ncbi:thioesterase superfamily protein [Solidesulfovibrio fructosivorans JJ]]|uniref:Thioesterase superfamily protein n=1 Tax=Solidesulfovibrio fructosivorans JJ] TaxID=596151 RepID=E1JWR7_SOLFR|nr:hotdog domain-containing protein [Solidesulfovibrio fructosivorans]EFL51121.1 thioesterase superfamily protein [Solidesulfovibrio fructosivorans JJ]]
MRQNTHLRIDTALCGTPVELSTGRAVVKLTTSPAMAADDRGLVHGGFVFGLADYAAMLAVNDPLVVLGAATVRFTAPVAVGEELVAEAGLVEEEGKKRLAEVTVRREETTVLTGTFTCFVPPRHVLDT